jgi:putative protease
VLSVPEIAALNRAITVETEAFVFGGLCVMMEGRCDLSSYATGRSPNLSGVCSPPEAVSYVEDDSGTTAKLAASRSTTTSRASRPAICAGSPHKDTFQAFRD